MTLSSKLNTTKEDNIWWRLVMGKSHHVHCGKLSYKGELKK